jgi:hypothetical protein
MLREADVRNEEDNDILLNALEDYLHDQSK